MTVALKKQTTEADLQGLSLAELKAMLALTMISKANAKAKWQKSHDKADMEKWMYFDHEVRVLNKQINDYPKAKVTADSNTKATG